MGTESDFHELHCHLSIFDSYTMYKKGLTASDSHFEDSSNATWDAEWKSGMAGIEA